MYLALLSEKDFLNPYYRKKQITQNEFDHFNKALSKYLLKLEQAHEQNEDYLVANALSPFLASLNFKTHIKTKQKGKSEIDLSITKDELSTDLEVLIEAKKINSKEFISQTKPNAKALHESILYYFRNREHSFSLKFIIITDFYKFYVFRSRDFEELFYKNAKFKKLFENFNNENSLFKGNTDEFYKEAAKIIEASNDTLKGFFIDLTPFKDKQNSNFKNLSSIFKIFNKDFLLNEFSPNDANSLNNAFYKELLYILGLCEQNSKAIITQSEQSKQGQGTLYYAIESKLEDKNFETILKFIILWLNRILFLKLIESNLIRFNNDKNLKFLNYEKIPNFTALSHLFFDILAKEKQKRSEGKFSYLPYLNSSLFEKQDIEKSLLSINALDDDSTLEYFPHTQLKDENGKSKKGKVLLLEYLFEFLDSFDFGSDEQSEELIKQKELINSSVLGNVFEKLNGYKEGSFYTPSFITSYMCKESISKVVLDKFNAKFKLNSTNLNELKKDLRDFRISKEEKLDLLNSIRICDPAVGSGHFLVSALNCLLMVYYELNLFEQDFYLSIENDEILVQNEKGEFIEYKRPSFEKDKAHQIQKELFECKKLIIENNLFGVDINSNSCEITKLRLWIELLKHSYYQSFENEYYHDLKTLPNIDINIKCGNSLISYFDINKSLTHYPNIKERMDKYKRIVKDYKDGFYTDKTMISKEIQNLKTSFKNFCLKDKFAKEIKAFTNDANEYSKKYGDFLINSYDDENFKSFFSKNMFEFDFDESKAKKEFTKLTKLYESIFDLESSHPFEWRFEFPEVLDESGNFKGFDLIIGNPPYIKENDNKEVFTNTKNLRTYQGKMDIWYHFVGRGFDVLKENANLSFIATNNWITNQGAKKLRNIILEESQILNLIDFSSFMVFDSASIQTMIMEFKKTKPPKNYNFHFAKIITQTPDYEDAIALLNNENSQNNEILDINFTPKNFIDKTLNFVKSDYDGLFEKIQKYGKFYLDEKEVAQGIVPAIDEAFIIKDKDIFSEKEQCFIKEYYTGLSGKFYSDFTDKYLIYLSKKNYSGNLDDLPNLKQHFKKYKEILKESKIKYKTPNKPYFYLHREREEKFFKKGEKIISQVRCIEPIFAYSNENFYGSRALFFIQTYRINLKYLTGLLNSKLIAFWLKHKGKIQGNLFKIDKEPLLNIPIVDINSKNEKLVNELASLVDEILKAKEQNKNANTQEQENKINSIVYKLYNLTEEEIKIIEGK
ncbi:class I SAM-dependent DNA methyltransferase [Campylobacter volucris]|uniref:site-specific DNA-methyltransferase (adenine-specific) n=1 Tax=Campylobacter volucris TaxID=1031542 RepID=A0A5C7DSY9_9BACT|nr:Eco57I restriction-modification methylase domain-containing protein [Campylobacter volucris]TXE87556.1 class I SAM-dependent DNA methyltransferase [Campylobacter volucris]